MKKLIIFTLAISLLLAAAVFGSQTRTLTMGDNHVVLTDNANIWNWASRLNDYPNLAVGEFGYFGTSNFGQFGVHWQFGDDDPWVLATYFDNMNNYSNFFGTPGGLGVPGQNRRIHLLYARSMGTNKFGARLSLYHSSQKFEDTSFVQYDESYSYYEGQVSLTADDNSWDVALTAGFGTWVDKNDSTTYSEPDGLIDFSVLGRMFWNSGPNYTYVPHAMIEYHKQGESYQYFTSANTDDETYKYTFLGLDLGIGQIYTPSNNVEAVLDAGIIFANFKEDYTDVPTPANNYEYKQNFLTIPYFKIGLDGEVFSWLDVRFGAESFWNRYKEEYTDAGDHEQYWANYADNATYLGFGFHWGNLHVDTYTDPNVFLNGFEFISGNGTNDMNFQLSAVYDLM